MTKPRLLTRPGFQEVGAVTPNLLTQMEKERAKSGVGFKLDIRLPEELVKRLLWLLVSGGALTAA